MTEKRKKPELKVVFDTNVLYTPAASDLLKPDVIELIKLHADHPDLRITWHIPEIVVHERKYQMIQKALDLLPNLEKLEKLLGHKLGISPEILEQRVDDAVKAQIKNYNLNVFSVDTSKINWGEVILSAAYRRPPFDRGEKEKGFRDAIVVESFLQLKENSPVTPKICRIALVTEDKLIRDAIKNKVPEGTNVRILSNIEDIKDLINALISEVNEEDLIEIKKVIEAYFFESSDDKTTFYYTQKVRDKIKEKFEDNLKVIPDGAETRENGTWYIGKPNFIKKSGRNFYWVNRIEVESKAYIKEVERNISPLASIPPVSQEDKSSKSTLATNIGLLSNLLIPTKKKLVKEGRTIFDVKWCVYLSPRNKPSRAKMEEISYVETNWEEPGS